MQVRPRIVMVSLLGAAVITPLTLAVPVCVGTNPAALSRVELGYPLSFVQQDMRRYTPVNSEACIRLNIEAPWSAPTRIHWLAFALDFAAIAALLWALTIATRRRTTQ